MNAIDISTGRIQDLADKFEITELVHRLGRALDEGDWDELAALYTHDATARTPGGKAVGRAALVGQAGRNHSPDRQIQHIISGIIVELNGDTATVRANLLCVFAWGPRRTPHWGRHPPPPPNKPPTPPQPRVVPPFGGIPAAHRSSTTPPPTPAAPHE
ncbi:nuclear transport factor 2 family protein, partial [Nocardia tengchongensis]|uniref:nuclear transport factor 2 family protein n=1 Tax=Nocardia tengchongensis TaxID=2055889 RepID=UPI0036ADBA2E